MITRLVRENLSHMEVFQVIPTDSYEYLLNTTLKTTNIPSCDFRSLSRSVENGCMTDTQLLFSQKTAEHQKVHETISPLSSAALHYVIF